MSDLSSIRNSIQILAETALLRSKPNVYVAEVIEVDKPQALCSCRLLSGNSDIDLSTVRLMSLCDNGLLLIPAIGSTVIIESGQGIQPFVTMFSKIDEALLICGDQQYNIKEGLQQFNKGEFGGLVKVIELTKKINIIENDLNTLKAAFNTWIVSPGDGGAALRLAAASWYASTLTPTIRTDIENAKVKHGDSV